MANRNMPIKRSTTDQQWNPIREISRLQRNIDDIFQDFFSPVGWTSPLAQFRQPSEVTSFVPQVDIEETDTHYVLAVDLPGVSKEDLKIEVNDNQLSISGERRVERHEGSRRTTERFYGSFVRAFALPPHVDPNNVEANYQDGVLYVAIPKVEAAQTKTVEIGEKKGGILEKIRQTIGIDTEKKSEEQQEKIETEPKKTAEKKVA